MSSTIRLSVVVVGILLGSTLGRAQPEMGDGPPLRPGEFLQRLFPPSVLMRHQRDIGLSGEQRRAITREMTATHKRLLELRWQLEAETAELAKLLDAARVDESTALERAGRVLELERQVKRAHLAMLVRLKNVLTPEQQARLRALRPHWRGGRGAGRWHAPPWGERPPHSGPDAPPVP